MCSAIAAIAATPSELQYLSLLACSCTVTLYVLSLPATSTLVCGVKAAISVGVVDLNSACECMSHRACVHAWFQCVILFLAGRSTAHVCTALSAWPALRATQTQWIHYSEKGGFSPHLILAEDACTFVLCSCAWWAVATQLRDYRVLAGSSGGVVRGC
jgi:hypothetical protein